MLQAIRSLFDRYKEEHNPAAKAQIRINIEDRTGRLLEGPIKLDFTKELITIDDQIPPQHPVAS